MRKVLFVALVFGLTRTAAAQVGSDPAKSPYRDIRNGQFISISGGYFGGNGGDLGIGPRRGSTLFLRHDFLDNRTVSIALAGGVGWLERLVVDTAAAASQQLRGPVDQKVAFAEGAVNFNLTGNKTWHRLAPYVGTSVGLAFMSKVPSDTSGFKLGTRFYFAPTIGTRVLLSQRLFLRLEARSVFWSLSYPTTFATDPDGTAGPRTPLLQSSSLKQWVPSGWYQIGLAYAFHRPF